MAAHQQLLGAAAGAGVGCLRSEHAAQLLDHVPVTQPLHGGQRDPAGRGLGVRRWVAGVSRSAAYEARRRRDTSEPARRRPGPVGATGDTELLAEIRGVLADSPFVGEGHRKVWARLRRERGVYSSRKRVLRLTREAGLLAPTAQVRKGAARLHDAKITVQVPDTLWATDATSAFLPRWRPP